MSRAVPGALALAAVIPLLAAGEAPKGAAPARFRLGGPEAYLLDWNARSPAAADLDGDGRKDLAVLNNDRARIEFLHHRKAGEAAAPAAAGTGRWEPALEDARFRKASLVTGIAMFSLVAGDLNGDGKADLAYTGSPDGLTVRIQGEKGGWDDARVFEVENPSQEPGSLAAADVNGDRRLDLVVLAKREICVFAQEPKGGFGAAARYPTAEEDGRGLLVRDLDGDGDADLAWIAQGKGDPLRIRFQEPPGAFGPERSCRILAPRGSLLALPGKAGEAAQIAAVQAQTGLVETLSISGGKAGDASLPSPRIFAARTAGRTPPSFAVGDLDGDKRLDVACSDPGGAAVLVWLQRSTGVLGEPTRYPAPADLRAIAAGDADQDGKCELYLASAKEQMVGVSRFAEGRLSYPRPIATGGKALALAAADLDGDGDLDLAFLKEEERKRSLAILRQDRPGGEWKAEATELAGLRTDPEALRVLDADQDGRPDLAVFVPQEPMRILAQTAEGAFRDLSTEASFRKGLVDRLEPSALSLGDVDGDGKSEMIAAATGFARALRLSAKGELEVVDQYNARESDAEIAAALPADLDGDGKPEMVLVERRADALQVLRRSAEGVFRHAESVPAGRIDLLSAEVVDLDADGRKDLLLFGRDRFWWIPPGAGSLRARTLSTVEPSLPGISYAFLGAGDLDGDGKPDLVAVDGGADHLLEIYGRAGAGWSRALHFTVFESDPHYGGRKGAPVEPREMLIDDLTGDGKADLALLIHDRLLIYPQE